MNKHVIVITGASSGFGRAAAETLAQHGHTVYATLRDSTGKNRAVARDLQSAAQTGGTRLHVLELDVTNTESVERAMQTVVKDTGRLDVLVNNAGVFYAGITKGFTPEQAAAQFDVNVIGIIRTMRAALPHFRRQGSGADYQRRVDRGPCELPILWALRCNQICAGGAHRGIRYELSQLGIDVTLLQPSAYPTSRFANMQGPADMARVAEYGEVAKIPGAMMEDYGKMFSSSDAPDAQEIADAIDGLIAQPGGTRPFRTVVGADFGAKTINAQIAPVQAGVLKGLGLGHLDTLKVRG